MRRYEQMVEDGQRAAFSLPVQLVSRETGPDHSRATLHGRPPAWQHHLVCRRCRQSIACLSPDATLPGYVTTVGDLVAQATAHIRRSHEDMIPIR